jgi:pimeloyl-ACP methyl ester carboxylesterase
MKIAARAGVGCDHRCDPVDSARQAIAPVASLDRTNTLAAVPTLVMHGLADRICDVSGGRATAEVIPGAEFVLIEGMGHDLPPSCGLNFGPHRRVDMVKRLKEAQVLFDAGRLG